MIRLARVPSALKAFSSKKKFSYDLPNLLSLHSLGDIAAAEKKRRREANAVVGKTVRQEAAAHVPLRY